MRKIFFAALLMISASCFAQNQNDKIKVFLDCTQSWLCDFDYVRSEIKAVDFVRDRFDADVHILVNMQNSSSGGTQSQMNFLGLRRFQNLNDTITYFNDPTTTDDEKRKKLVQYLKVGLTRYFAQTPYAAKMEINFPDAGRTDSASAGTKKDPWNYWVFQFGANGSFNGDQNYQNRAFYGYLSADRETEEWKINISTALDNSREIIKDTSGDLQFDRKSYSSEVQIAKSINSHWSYGLAASYTNSLYSNLKAAYSFTPKIEYSVFPYSKFNSQRIVFQYLIGPGYYQYYDSTIYFKIRETQVQQNLRIITSFTKPWGSINVGIFYSNYFEDFKKNNLSFNGAVSWKITKGLLFAIWGNYGLIHDQINLRKGHASRDDVLKQNRELESSFQYNLGIGFSYRFGSILNNIVNPRFKGLNYSINL
jgi:hypothetical protein